ncbi:MAG: hypothetical protein MH825_02890 [Cyanobacteria bacterium]|nr:hypothetical protein [Cyanobacteriota bacterium]
MRPTPDRWTYDYSPVSSAAVPGQGGLWGPLQPTSTSARSRIGRAPCAVLAP